MCVCCFVNVAVNEMKCFIVMSNTFYNAVSSQLSIKMMLSETTELTDEEKTQTDDTEHYAKKIQCHECTDPVSNIGLTVRFRDFDHDNETVDRHDTTGQDADQSSNQLCNCQ